MGPFPGRRVGGAVAAAAAALAVAAPAAVAGPLRAGAAQVDATWHVGSAAGQYASGCEHAAEVIERGPGAFDSGDEAIDSGAEAVMNCPVVGVHGVDPAAHSVHRAPAYGVQSRPTARAIVIEGPGGNRWALVKNDLYIPQDLLWRRTAQVLQAAGSKIGQRNLSMAVSHNHSSPYHSSISWGVWAFQDAFDARFFEYYAQRMAQAVLAAEKALVPVRVGAAVGQFDKTHKHSFGGAIADDGTPAGYPEADIDTDLSVVRFDDISEPARPKPLALIMNWGGHPEFLNGNNLISGDYQAPLERIVDRATGALTIFTQGAVGTGEPERSRFHDPRERLEFNHREYGQAEYAGRLMGDAVIDLWRRIGSDDPPDRSRYVPFRSDFAADEVEGEDRWFGGPISHPYPTVSNCRTPRALEGDPGIPLVGLPDCERELDGLKSVFGPLYKNTGLHPEMFKEAGVPIPENYSVPSYTGLQEDIDVHLQALRIGDLLLTFCSCEQWKDQSLNIKTRTDKIAGNEYLGYDWTRPSNQPGTAGTIRGCTRRTDGRWDCPNPERLDGDLVLEDRLVQRMRAQVNNPANGWNEPQNAATAESEPADPAQIKGNFTHDDSTENAAKGYAVTIALGMVNDYNGYIASYREYQRGDHYRKALTGWGPHSADYLATRLVKMGRRLKDGTTDPEDTSDKLLAGKTVVDNAINEGRAQALGALGQAAIAAWSNLMPDSAPPAAKSQPRSIQRFDATFFTWRGGDNFTDQPFVRVERSVNGRWLPFADQSGEVQTTFRFPRREELPNLVAEYFQGTREWLWTAHFEAFASYFDTGGQRATPAGTYRFVVDGFSRRGRASLPYHLVSEEFKVEPWKGITVEELRREADGTLSFRAGPTHEVDSYNIDATQNLRERKATRVDAQGNPLPDRRVTLGPIDYPDTYGHPEKADFIAHVNSYKASGAHLETYCFTCSFRPWADTGDAVAAAFTVLGADGTRDELVAVRRPDGRFATPRPLAPGERAFVAAGDVCDGWGNVNGAAAYPPGESAPSGVSDRGTFCSRRETQPPASDTGAPTTPIPDSTHPAPASQGPGFTHPVPNPVAAVGGDLLGSEGARAPRCLPRRMSVGSRGIGRARLGWTARRIERALGRRGERARRTLAWCVQGGGTVVAVFSRKGDARLLLSTARGHRSRRGAGPGRSRRALRRAYPQARSIGGRIYVTYRSTRIVFAIGRSGARYIAVVDRRLTKNDTLRSYLRQAGVLR